MIEFHQKEIEEEELSQTIRDRFLFFLLLALIIHLFVVFNIAHTSKLPSKLPSMEIIFSKSKTDQLRQGENTKSEAIDKEKDQHPRSLPEPKKKEAANQREQKTILAELKKPSAEQLIARSLAQARKHYDLIDNPYFRTNKPRRKYITANNKDHRFASYMEAWRAKVERVGNINYPHEARKKHLSGKLLLDVAIQRDGTVQQVTIRRSSGKKVLDQAAIRIVELAAPFAPLPESITKEVDILHITRTWNFVNDSQFTAP